MEELRRQLHQMQHQATTSAEREAEREAERLAMKSRLGAIPMNATKYMQPQTLAQFLLLYCPV